MANYTYDIAISFAGEDREVAEALANALASRNIKVFYDKFEAHNLWGKNLIEYLYEVYAKKAKYCVIFVSKNYVQKAWPRHERRSAQERALTEEQEYILPILIDEVSLPGLPNTIGYIRLNDYTIDQITGLLTAKLGISIEEPILTPQPIKSNSQQFEMLESPFNINKDKRYLSHEEFSSKLLPLKDSYGYFALHSLPPSPIDIPDNRIKETFLNPSLTYSEALSYASRTITHQNGYTRPYQIKIQSGEDKVTQATTCYCYGHIATEGYLDPFLKDDTGFNPMWFIYKIQRHLQLTKEVFEGLIQTFTCAVILRNIDKFGWEIYSGHKIYEKSPYTEYHEDIFVSCHVSEIHGRDKWNLKMQLVENIMVKIARMFGIDGLPQPYWNEEGKLLYPLGMPGR